MKSEDRTPGEWVKIDIRCLWRRQGKKKKERCRFERQSIVFLIMRTAERGS